MGYVAPTTRATGFFVTASVWDQDVVDNQLAAFPLGVDAWPLWSPTLTNLTLGSGTSVGVYQRVGRTVQYRWKFTLGAGSAVGAVPSFTLPVAPAAAYSGQDCPLGDVMFIDQGTASYRGQVALISGSTVSCGVLNVAGTYLVLAAASSTVPFTFVATDAIWASGTYEAAS